MMHHSPSGRPVAPPHLTSILHQILDSTIELQGADFGSIHLYDEATGALTIVAHRGLDQGFLDYFARVDASVMSACGRALHSGSRIVIEDVNTEPDFEPHRGVAAAAGFRGVQSTPVRDRKTGKLLGLLSTHFREPHRPSEHELRLTDGYARQAADVICFWLAERALYESEARLSAILNQVPGAVGMFDRDGKFVLRGGPLSDLWDEAIPSHDPGSNGRWQGFDADGRRLSPSQYPGARALRGETTAPGLDFLRSADDGQETWFRVSAAPFRNENGEIAGGISILENVDERKRAGQRLRESEARLKVAINLVKLGLYAWNPKTNELQWDDTVRAMWGLSADAPVDYATWLSGVHPEDLARVEAAVRRCADPRGDGVYDIEYRVIRKSDGIERWIATRGQTHFENQEPVSFHGVALDITDRKRIEKALERRVEARTRELEEANRQLRSQIEQRELAEASVQQLQRLDAIGQITSGVAHDFNNLLSVVLANARLLARNLRDPGDQEGVELICGAAERGANLTAQLLAFSRKQRLEPQEVDLNGKLLRMRDLLSVTFGGTIKLRTALAGDLWPALVDPTQIELIVLNLAINARDAMPSGGVLTLETFNAVIDDGPFGSEDPLPGHYVALAVNDTGVGIPDDVLPRVFEPFFTTKEPGKGSGLGLSQVFGFAKQSGGGVAIESAVGEGTSVRVFLPRAEAVRRDRDEEPSADAGPGAQARKKGTIVVVDDDKAVLRTTVRMLDMLGYAAVAAGSGEEALRLIASGMRIDLVLADFAMPEMTGGELAETIRATRPALPVILVTGFGNSKVLKDFGEARILQKPYAEDELLERIARALN
jgi:PAS domain S-box-containing protein